jgi:hypothetical protein
MTLTFESVLTLIPTAIVIFCIMTVFILAIRERRENIKLFEALAVSMQSIVEMGSFQTYGNGAFFTNIDGVECKCSFYPGRDDIISLSIQSRNDDDLEWVFPARFLNKSDRIVMSRGNIRDLAAQLFSEKRQSIWYAPGTLTTDIIVKDLRHFNKEKIIGLVRNLKEFDNLLDIDREAI